ncbi:MAG: type I 3-dehydroquinate dehydratase [Thermoproteota archaeon]|nr:type I 3-dehydroquinate dehydratase [Candidatus Brockarchaeota archaeon]
MKTFIVASLPVKSPKDIDKVKDIDSDFVELRLDYLNSLQQISIRTLLKFKRKIIVTVRDVNEGGVNLIDREEKRNFLVNLHKYGILYDVEASFLKKYPVPYKGKIVSVHYLSNFPSFFEVKKLADKFTRGTFAFKVVVNGVGNYRQLLISLLSISSKVVVMPINTNPVERIAFAIFGSKLVYGYVETPTAPGQMSYTQLKRIMKELNFLNTKVK